MTTGRYRYIIVSTFTCSILAAWIGCKKSFSPKLVNQNVQYLVVEGVINIGNDSTIINLSRTVKVNSKSDSAAELKAVINVEGNDNSSYPIMELGNGRYGAPALGLDLTKQYRIHIRTVDAKEYVSDFTPCRPTPPIDTVGFNALSNGIQIYVNTHDPKNNTHYYRWSYEETWAFHSEYPSDFVSNGSAIVPRSGDIYSCFTHDASSDITLSSSEKLSQDIIYQAPIIFIPSTSEKIETRYSILLKQYALTSEEYNYWQNLKKNTEQIGSIFDAQPSELQGNIHCITDPTVPVIGYVGATTIQQKRVFIARKQLPEQWSTTYPYACQLDTFLFCRGASCINEVLGHLVPLPPVTVPTWQVLGQQMVTGYMGASTECVDCTLRGTKQVPAFW